MPAPPRRHTTSLNRRQFLAHAGTAALVAGMCPRHAAAVWRAVRSQAPAHPSPNAGVAEAAFAAALGLRLGGCNRYGDRVEQRPWLGQGRPAARSDIQPAVRLRTRPGRLPVLEVEGEVKPVTDDDVRAALEAQREERELRWR